MFLLDLSLFQCIFIFKTSNTYVNVRNVENVMSKYKRKNTPTGSPLKQKPQYFAENPSKSVSVCVCLFRNFKRHYIWNTLLKYDQ